MKSILVSHEDQELAREPDAAELGRAGGMSDSDAEVEYKKLVGRGSVLSMVSLGHLYEHRRLKDGGPNFAESEFWYRSAVDSGSAVATFYCGCFYLRRSDYYKAKKMFQLGSDRGYAPSIVRLANLYIKGLGVERDYSRAKDLLARASELGNLWATLAAATMTVTLSESVFVKVKGLGMVFFAAIKFRIEKWRHPESERLKK